MKPWQIQELEALYRQAVQLAVNPAGGATPCELGCGRLGEAAHHCVRRSQEPGTRWLYEPRWGLYLCRTCHAWAHTFQDEFVDKALARLQTVRPAKARTLRKYIENHDRLRCPDATFEFMRAYIKRRITKLQHCWADAFCCDL